VPRSTILEEEVVDFSILDTDAEQEEEVQFPYTCLRFEPYPTPFLLLLAVLLAATI